MVKTRAVEDTREGEEVYCHDCRTIRKDDFRMMRIVAHQMEEIRRELGRIRSAILREE
jgi:hypothetical protein